MADQDTQTPKETAITVSRGSLAAFAPDPEKVKALAAEFVMTLTYRGAQDLNYQERVALAAASLAYNLSPALGEIWILHGQGMFVGVAGWVKKMNEFAEKHGFQWRGNEVRIYKEDFSHYGIPDDAQIAYKYVIRRSDFDDFYSQRCIELAKAGFTYDQCKEIIGLPPQIVGVGWLGRNEVVDSGSKGAKMSPGQKAIKRAVTDALKKIVHLPFAGEGDMLQDGKAVDTETMYISSGPDKDDKPQPEAEEGEIIEAKAESAVEPAAPAIAIAQPEASAAPSAGAPFTPPTPEAVKAQITGVATALASQAGRPIALTYEDARKKRPTSQLQAIDFLRRASGDKTLAWAQVEKLTREKMGISNQVIITPTQHWLTMVGAVEAHYAAKDESAAA